jgi:hypothetical protein
MSNMQLMPISGMKTEGDDTRLIVTHPNKSQEVFMRDIADLDVHGGGAVSLRPGMRLVTDKAFANLWQSPLHGDVFGTLGEDWVKVSTNWEGEVLAKVGDAECWHAVLNNKVVVSGEEGLFEFDGAQARRLTIEACVPPMVSTTAHAGALVEGDYGVALAFMRGDMEGPLSEMLTVKVKQDYAPEVVLPLAFDSTITKVRIYMTKPDGGELGLVGEHAPASSVIFPTIPAPGIAPRFPYMRPMPAGKYVSVWQGRLLTAVRNVLHFSEPLAYHINDPRHGFVQMPQRITFLAPVEGGIWVGQVDHVVFLQGAQPDQMAMQRRAVRAPVPGSALLIPAEVAGDAAQGGRHVAAWLSANGFVLGTASGEVVETGAGKLGGISGIWGQSAQAGDRVHTLTR